MISGDFITCKINGVEVAGVQKWSAQSKRIRLNGQTASDAGYSHPASGTRSVTFRISLVVDINTGSLLALEDGTEVTDLGLFADVNASDPIFSLPDALILGVSPGGGMNEMFAAEIEGENVGPFTFNDPN